jgi:hypothetical protein
MSRFDRAPRKRSGKIGKRESALAIGVAAVGAAWLATRDGVPELPHTTDTATTHHEPDAGKSTVERMPKTAADDALEHEDPGLEGEDLLRAREHAAFKKKTSDALLQALPEGSSVHWTIATDATDGKPEYNEFLKIVGKNGFDYGEVYPDEETGQLTFIPDEDLSQFYGDVVGSPLAPYDLSAPADITMAVEDVTRLSGYQTQWDQFENEWPTDTRFIESDDGTMTMNPDYETQRDALKEEMQGVLDSTEVTTAREAENRAEEEADEQDTGD